MSLRVFLFFATLQHAGLILWAVIFAANIPDRMRNPPDWGSYLDPLGATPRTFEVYLCALILNLAWDTLWDAILTPPTADNPGFKFFKPRLGDIVLYFWAFFALVVHYSVKKGFSPEMPSQLDQTLIASVLLCVTQTAIEGALLNPQVRSELEPVVPTTLLPDPPSPSPGVLAQEENSMPVQIPVDLEKRLLDFIGQKGLVKTVEIVNALGLPTRTVNHYQKKLILDGRIVRVGQGKLATYKLGDKQKG
jgi:hypothetical protein